MAKYQTVNAVWPEVVPDLTEQEALAAARRLYRFAMKRKIPYKLRLGKLRNRSVDIDSGGMIVDHRRGWRGLVHSMSHRCHFRLYRNAKNFSGHDTRHAWIEREMIRKVVESGWLEGRLRREPKPEPEVDHAQTRRDSTLAALARWTTKAKRADTALRKLRRRLRYYDRKLAA